MTDDVKQRINALHRAAVVAEERRSAVLGQIERLVLQLVEEHPNPEELRLIVEGLDAWRQRVWDMAYQIEREARKQKKGDGAAAGAGDASR